MAHKAVIDSGHKCVIPCVGNTIEGVRFEYVFNHVDDRGHLSVLAEKGITLDPDEVIGRVYITTAHKGVIKAWHEHLKQTDRMAVAAGKVKFGLWDTREGSPTYGNMIFAVISPLDPYLMIIPPGVRHGFTCLEEDSIVVNMPDRNYDSNDEIRYESNPQQWAVKNG